MNNTLLFKVNPFTKIIALIMVAVSIFFPIGMTGTIFTFVFVLSLSLYSLVPLKTFSRITKLSIVTFSMLLLSNIVVGINGTEMLFNATHFTMKLITVLLAATLITHTTTPYELTKGIRTLISPLKFVKVPINDLSLMISISISFIPIVLLDVKEISKINKVRGIELLKPLSRIKYRFKAFSPMMIQSFRRADEISNTLISRGYVAGQPKSTYIPIK
ncbi:MAG: hypothetical protein DRP42_03405 [Tenericutes bacterium]|nr:MAG: hypothetical protein DRP42_03405 [Mycoplasmatota bacterium]